MTKTLSVSESEIAPHSIGVWPSGKAHGFGPCIRGFESLHPSHRKSLRSFDLRLFLLLKIGI